MARPKLRMLGARVATLDSRIPTAPKRADEFYSSRSWLDLRDRVRREARGMCEAPGCSRPGRIVDHKIERKDGGAELDRNNVWLMCQSCHTTKTNVARARRQKQ